MELLPQKELPDLKTIVIAGDVCDPQVIKYWSQGRRFVNAYGPTETTVCATMSIYNKNKVPRQIGTHIQNFQTYVLDNNLQPVSVGIPGELYVSGIGLARGYLNRQDLTIERFVAHPFMNDPIIKMYKTGDLVRWLSSGELEFLGRSDAQVKIRGFRIELGEIETLLNQYPGITQAVVVVKSTVAGKDLVAFYVVGANAQVTIEELRSYLNRQLPAYMIPTSFIKLDKMPLNPSGKIDRKVLEKSQQSVDDATVHYVEPETMLQKKLATIWATLLNYQKIGLQDNFFAIGGHSLMAVKMQSIVREKLGKDFNLLAFMQNPILHSLAELIEGKVGAVQSVSSNLALALQDATTAITMPKNLQYAQDEISKEVLLTGATGFLGVYLLDSLLRNTNAIVHCIVRSESDANLLTHFNKSLQQYGFAKLQNNPRIKLWRGDLSKEKLGLAENTYQYLVANIDVIYHNGAWVNHVFDYKTLRSTNVGSTLELLKMATAKKAKAFNYISTFSCASNFAADGSTLEAGPGDKPISEQGYALSKWVAEKIIWRARELGLHAKIFRPGNVTGDSKTGQTNFAMNHFLLFVKSCIQLGYAPMWDMKIEMEPVNLLTDALVAIAQDNSTDNGMYNLVNPNYIMWKEYVAYLNKLGYAVKLIDPAIWLKDYLMPAHEDNALFPLKGLYQDQETYVEPPHFLCDESQKIMRKHEIAYPHDYFALINLYNNYLIQVGFLSKT